MAQYAGEQKVLKYQALAGPHALVPVVIETMCAHNDDGLQLLNSLGGKLISKTGDLRQRMFLFQRISMAVQRGNAACFTASFRQNFFHLDLDQ